MHNATQTDLPTVAGLQVRTCVVPMEPPVQTASGTIAAAPLVLIDLHTSTGVTGSTYLFTYSPVALKPTADLIRGLAPLITGQPLAPSALQQMLCKRFTLLGTEGLVMMAIAGIDMAAWDALARVQQQPLARTLGGALKPIPVYASLRSMQLDPLMREIEQAQAKGIQAFKFRIGAGSPQQDLAHVQAVRRAVGADAKLMVDYNQSLNLVQAKERIQALDGECLAWVEEPLLMNDIAGQVELRRSVRTPLQAGENWWGVEDAARSINAGATDHAMPDVMKIGGVTGWQHTVALAKAAGLPVSSHLFEQISAHLMLVTPTAHLLEIIDLASPLLMQPLHITNGHYQVADEPGSGIAWNEGAVKRYEV